MCVRVSVCACECVWMRGYICACVCTYVYVMCMCVCICVCIFACVYMCMRIDSNGIYHQQFKSDVLNEGAGVKLKCHTTSFASKLI